jgi:L(+)-tartrate dehydratase beta subunit
MNTYRLEIPLSEDAVRKLRVGDVVFLDGKVHTGRALVYQHVLEKGNPIPIDIASVSNVQMHAAPAGREEAPGKYRISSIQATASFRYGKWVPDYVRKFGIRAIIGKGGMDGAIYRDVFAQTGTVFLTTVGYGIAAIYGRGVESVDAVYWKDALGLPEAMWVINARNFGPFIVDGDCTGASLSEQATAAINPNFAQVYAGMQPHVLKRMGEIGQDLEQEVIAGNAGDPQRER